MHVSHVWRQKNNQSWLFKDFDFPLKMLYVPHAPHATIVSPCLHIVCMVLAVLVLQPVCKIIQSLLFPFSFIIFITFQNLTCKIPQRKKKQQNNFVTHFLLHMCTKVYGLDSTDCVFRQNKTHFIYMTTTTLTAIFNVNKLFFGTELYSAVFQHKNWMNEWILF